MAWCSNLLAAICWRRSLFDHCPADVLGRLSPADQIPGCWADLHGAAWPDQVDGQHWPVVDQVNGTLLLELPHQWVLADALAVARGEPDPIGLKKPMAIRAEHSPLIAAPSR